jgi:multidrug efflux pump subunit AcrB
MAMGRSFSGDSGGSRDLSGARRRFNVSRFAIDHPWTIGIAWLAIAIWGAVAYANLKYSLLPDIALPVVVVTAHEQSIDVAATERDLTVPLERALATSKPTYYTSSTYPGRSVVQLTYGFGNTLGRHEAEVRAILKRLTLPKGSGYSIAPIDLNESAVNVYTVPFTGSDRARVLRDVRDVVIPELERIADVRRVELLGAPGSTSAARLRGRTVLELSVIKRADANALEVARESDAVVARLKPRLGIAIDLATTQAPYIRDASHATVEALAIALLLAALITLPFLRDWRATVISALAIPVSLGGAAIVMSLMHFDLEMITLLALALVTGVIVDDAIVDVENISRHVAAGEPPHAAAVAATDEIWLAASAATLTIMAVFLPIGLATGNFGQFFKPFGLTASAAVLTSLAVARTLSPMLASRFLREAAAPPPPGALTHWYGRILVQAIAHPKRSVALAVVAFLAGLALVKVIPVGFIPHLDRGDFVVYVTAPPGTSTSAFANASRPIEAAVIHDRDVRSVLTTIGENGNPAHAELDVVLRGDRRATTLAVEDRVRSELPKIRAYRTTVEDTPFVNSGLTRPIQLILTGSNRSVVDNAGWKLRAALAKTPGFIDVTRTASDETLGMTLRTVRYDGRYANFVDADLHDRSIGDATSYGVDLAHRILPASIGVSLGGDSQSASTTLLGFAQTLALSVICVIAVLVLLFRSWKAPLVILATLPLSVVGAMLGLLLWHADFSIISLLGFIFLFGLTGKNAILLVDAIERRRPTSSLADAIVEAGRVRLRPILMTTSATILGMLPIACGFGAGAELRAPMAVTIIGGLIASTLLTLVVVPAAYVLVNPAERTASPRRRESAARSAAMLRDKATSNG